LRKITKKYNAADFSTSHVPFVRDTMVGKNINVNITAFCIL